VEKKKESFVLPAMPDWGIIFNGDTVKIDRCLFCN